MDRQIQKKYWTLKRVGMFGIPSAILLFLILNLLLGDHRSKLNVETERLTISTVAKAPFQEFIPVIGTIEPFQTFYLDLTDGGRVLEKYVNEGAIVHAGDPIIKLDNPNLSLTVMSTQSNFMLAESQLRQTRLTFEQNGLMKESQLLDITMRLMTKQRAYEITKSLYDKGMASAIEYEIVKVEYEFLLKNRDLMMEVLKKDSLTNAQLIEQNERNVEQQKKYLNLISNQLENLTVRAPINGQLTSFIAEIGQSVGTGYRLGHIDNIDSFKIRAEIDEHYISKIVESQTGEYELDSKIFELKIKTVYPQVTNGKFNVDMVFINGQPPDMRRGQSVHIRLQLGGLSEAILLPRGGFYQTTGGQWIYVIDKTGNFAIKRNIKLGRQNPQMFEVLEGLEPGERVITSSYENYGEMEKLILK